MHTDPKIGAILILLFFGEENVSMRIAKCARKVLKHVKPRSILVIEDMLSADRPFLIELTP